MSFINFIQLISPDGQTWEHYSRRKWGVQVSRFHGWFDGKREKVWTKILSRPDATLRWRAFKTKGWRETRRNPKTKRNPIRGEWWIDDSGTALYADGDVGDMGHEAYVIDSLTRRLLDAMSIDVDDMAGVIGDWTDNIESVMREEEGEFDGDVDGFIEKTAKSIWKDPEQCAQAVKISYGGGDARKYGMQYDGWKRVQGHNVETWTLTTQDLKAITNGLYDAASGDEIADDETFNIYVFSTKMWYQEVPWSVLSEDDPGKLRIYGTKDNPPRVLSYAEAHHWEPLAKAKGVSEVARSSRGFMRMYEKARTWDNVNDYWRKRRAAFIARHMAQARHEKLWKRDRSGKLQPSRRCLALLMWAYKS